MAGLDNVYKQRMVGALVLIALAVIFLPMLFSRQDEMRQVRVEAPAAPAAPASQPVKVDPVQVPEPQVLPEPEPEPVVQSAPVATPQKAPSMPIAKAATVTAPQAPATTGLPIPEKPAVAQAPSAAPNASKIDANNLPISWSIQLASLSSREGADNLQKTLRSEGYSAYVRSAQGLNRVFVGPVIERADAERMRDAINRAHNLKGIVVRFAPEKG